MQDGRRARGQGEGEVEARAGASPVGRGRPPGEATRRAAAASRGPCQGLAVATVVAALLASGCASDGALARLSSGHVGCRPADVAISDRSTGWGDATWTAVCEGRLYYCSGAGHTVQCAPAKGEGAVPR